VGLPKPIVNIFHNESKAKEEVAAAKEEDHSPSKAEEAASIIEDAKQMYLGIIEEANSEAHKIVETAESVAQSLLSASKEKGQKEGFDAGYLEGKSEAQAIINEASEIRIFLDRRKESLYREAEEQILPLVMDISKKVIGEELSQNKDAILSLVRQALQKCAFKNKLVLKISPADFDFINDNKDRICMMAEGISDIDIVSDLSLPNGSCIIETPSGEVNSSVDVQIEEVEKIFNYLLRNG
jgi:flagellar assembly protein FliH